jgi:hypothetical protein
MSVEMSKVKMGQCVQMPLPFERQLAASALARSVFPVPGGPWNNTPRGGVSPNRWKTSGYSSGSSVISFSELISTPPSDICAHQRRRGTHGCPSRRPRRTSRSGSHQAGPHPRARRRPLCRGGSASPPPPLRDRPRTARRLPRRRRPRRSRPSSRP